jgi:hypothetical protein
MDTGQSARISHRTSLAAVGTGAVMAATSSLVPAEAFASSLAKSGVDVDKLDQIARQQAPEGRRATCELQGSAAKQIEAEERAFRKAIEDRRAAFDAAPPIILDKPFLMWEFPRLETAFVGSHNESMNSSIRISIDTNTGTDLTSFTFLFLWENESDFFAVTNVRSSLVLNGGIGVGAGTGIFSGDEVQLFMNAELALLEWWNQPPTTPIGQQSQSQSIVNWDVSAGGVFGKPHSKFQTFSFTPFDLSYSACCSTSEGCAVRGLVEHPVQLSLWPGGDINDFIRINFADGANRVICPFVEVDLLTPPPA